MTVNELAARTGAEPVVLADGGREIRGAYTGDLLSWVMGRGKQDQAWVTIMTNINIVAVATLVDFACIVVAEGAEIGEDVREAARVLKDRRVADGVRALAVPGSMAVRAAAEAEGLDRIFIEAGFEWRLPGCSMCLAMNDDRASEDSRVASTSNRNFVGRQGRGSRTHLMSPASAAAAAVAGHIADVRDYI